jgi:hypothetical protein
MNQKVLPEPYGGSEPPPPLPELTDQEKRLGLYGVPFREAFGKEKLQVLLKCRKCGEINTHAMWEWCGRLCFECGSNQGAVRAVRP